MSMDPVYLLQYRGARKAVEVYAGGDADLCWGSMTYACSEEHEERRWLGIGVEGPPELRALVVGAFRNMKAKGWQPGWVQEAEERMAQIGGLSFIPSPFFAGKCRVCGQAMKHVHWHEDKTWSKDEYRRPLPKSRYFRVPDEQTAMQYAREGYGGADLVTWERIDSW